MSAPGESGWTLSLDALPLGIYFATLKTDLGSASLRMAKLPSGIAGTSGSGSLRSAQGVGEALDSLQVPVVRQTMHSAVVTQKGRLYLLQSMGQGKVDLGDLNTDYGLAVDELQTGAPNAYAPRLRWWGLWRKDHTYYMLFRGTGNPIDFTYIDVGYGDNSATDRLTVRVFALP